MYCDSTALFIFKNLQVSSSYECEDMFASMWAVLAEILEDTWIKFSGIMAKNGAIPLPCSRSEPMFFWINLHKNRIHSNTINHAK